MIGDKKANSLKDVMVLGGGCVYHATPNIVNPDYTSCMTNNEGPPEYQFKECDVSQVYYIYIYTSNL